MLQTALSLAPLAQTSGTLAVPDYALRRTFASVVKAPTAADIFFFRVERGFSVAVARQLSAGFSADTRNAADETGLHVAARGGDLALIELLLASGASPVLTPAAAPMRTPLYEAIAARQSAAALALLDRRALIMERAMGEALIRLAHDRGLYEVCAALMAAGFETSYAPLNLQSPLATALKSGAHEEALRLLRDPAILARINSIETCDPEKNTPFQLAVAAKNIAAVTLMLPGGAFVNAPRADGMTPLLLAMAADSPVLVHMLLAAGADPVQIVRDRGDARRQLQPQPLLFLAGIPDLDDAQRAAMAGLLLAAGADPRCVDEPSGDTALHRLLSAPSVIQTMAVLLRAGADIEAYNRAGDTPLLVAAKAGAIHEVCNLLAAGANPHTVQARTGQTPLVCARELGYDDIAHELSLALRPCISAHMKRSAP